MDDCPSVKRRKEEEEIDGTVDASFHESSLLKKTPINLCMLPDDCLLKIFCSLTRDDLDVLEFVCKKTCEIANNNQFKSKRRQLQSIMITQTDKGHLLYTQNSRGHFASFFNRLENGEIVEEGGQYKGPRFPYDIHAKYAFEKECRQNGISIPTQIYDRIDKLMKKSNCIEARIWNTIIDSEFLENCFIGYGERIDGLQIVGVEFDEGIRNSEKFSRWLLSNMPRRVDILDTKIQEYPMLTEEFVKEYAGTRNDNHLVVEAPKCGALGTLNGDVTGGRIIASTGDINYIQQFKYLIFRALTVTPTQLCALANTRIRSDKCEGLLDLSLSAGISMTEWNQLTGIGFTFYDNYLETVRTVRAMRSDNGNSFKLDYFYNRNNEQEWPFPFPHDTPDVEEKDRVKLHALIHFSTNRNWPQRN